jgi:DNA polymerase/3'-5' exonuclease PolX
MNYKEALAIAIEIQSFYIPYAQEIDITGSLRRKDYIITDIDLVIMLDSKPEEFYDVFLKLAEYFAIKKSTLDVKVRVWYGQPENWGFLLVKTTGHPEYTPKELEGLWISQGYEEKDEFLYRGDEQMVVFSEKELYCILDLPFVAPWFSGFENP